MVVRCLLKMSPRGRITITIFTLNNDHCCREGMVSELLFTDFSISLISVLKRCRTQLQTSFQRRYFIFQAEPTVILEQRIAGLSSDQWPRKMKPVAEVSLEREAK